MGFVDILQKTLDLLGVSWTQFFTVTIPLLILGLYLTFILPDRDYIEKPRDPSLPPATEVVSLRIYPIKSCRGISVDSVKLKMSGLELDRNWMFVNAADNVFLTIRSDPTMTLIDTSIDRHNDELVIAINGTEDSVRVPAHPSKAWLDKHTTLEEVEIWEVKTDGWAYGDDVNDIFVKYFKKPVKLIYKGPTSRISGGNASPELYGKSVPTMFADLMSVQIASESSMADLNAELDEAKYEGERLTIERFRPNIVVKGNKPWEEDSWKSVRISTAEHEKKLLWRVGLDVVCRCARCQVPNVNPDTAEKHPRQPWDTLMKFRRVDKGGVAKYKPCFGMLCLPQNEGPITVGSKLEVMAMTDKHLYNTAKFEDL